MDVTAQGRRLVDDADEWVRIGLVVSSDNRCASTRAEVSDARDFVPQAESLPPVLRAERESGRADEELRSGPGVEPGVSAITDARRPAVLWFGS